MKSIFISDIMVYHGKKERVPRMSRTRFSDLMARIMKLHGENLREDSLLQGGQYSYLELCKEALGTWSVKEFADVMIFPNTTSEFDPDEASFGAGFQATFGEIDIYDISYQGIVSCFSAIHFGCKLLSNNPLYRRVGLIGVELNTNALPVNYQGPIPTENSFGRILLNTIKTENSIEVVASGVLLKDQLNSVIENLFNKKRLDEAHFILNLVTGDLSHYAQIIKNRATSIVEYPNSVNTLCNILNDISIISKTKGLILLIIPDCYTENCGYLALQKGESN